MQKQSSQEKREGFIPLFSLPLLEHSFAFVFLLKILVFGKKSEKKREETTTTTSVVFPLNKILSVILSVREKWSRSMLSSCVLSLLKREARLFSSFPSRTRGFWRKKGNERREKTIAKEKKPRRKSTRHEVLPKTRQDEGNKEHP